MKITLVPDKIDLFNVGSVYLWIRFIFFYQILFSSVVDYERLPALRFWSYRAKAGADF